MVENAIRYQLRDNGLTPPKDRTGIRSTTKSHSTKHDPIKSHDGYLSYGFMSFSKCKFDTKSLIDTKPS